MNDIEILEKLENMQKTFIEEGLQGYEMVIVNTKNLINKLISRNKELEEKNKELDTEVSRLWCTNRGYENNYISKDKIKEKIEELEKRKDEYTEQPLIYHILKNQLKELLEQ